MMHGMIRFTIIHIIMIRIITIRFIGDFTPDIIHTGTRPLSAGASDTCGLISHGAGTDRSGGIITGLIMITAIIHITVITIILTTGTAQNIQGTDMKHHDMTSISIRVMSQEEAYRVTILQLTQGTMNV